MKSKRQPQIGDVYYLHYHGHAKFFLVNNISNFRISGRTFDINGNYFGEQYFLESAKDFFCQVDFLGKVDPYSPEIHDFMNRYIHCEINSSNPFPSDLKQNLILCNKL